MFKKNLENLELLEFLDLDIVQKNLENLEFLDFVGSQSLPKTDFDSKLSVPRVLNGHWRTLPLTVWVVMMLGVM